MGDLEARLNAIDAGSLAPVVSRVLNRDRVTIGDWTCTPMSYGAINPATAGLYQLSGTAFDGEEPLPWSVILKVVHWVDLSGTPLAHEYMNEPGDWNYWKREALVFQSGILDAWAVDLVPVRCYQVVEQTGDEVWMWLEHVREPHEAPGTWTATCWLHDISASSTGQPAPTGPCPISPGCVGGS